MMSVLHDIVILPMHVDSDVLNFRFNLLEVKVSFDLMTCHLDLEMKMCLIQLRK